MNDLSIDPPHRPTWISKVVGKLHKLIDDGEVTSFSAKHAVDFMGALEIEYGLPEPDLKIGKFGNVLLRWKKKDRDLILIIKQPGVNGRYRSVVRHVSYGNLTIDCVTVRLRLEEVRSALAVMFDVDARWQKAAEW